MMCVQCVSMLRNLCFSSFFCLSVLCPLISSHPTWLYLTPHHVQVVCNLFRFIGETLSVFILHPLSSAPDEFQHIVEEAETPFGRIDKKTITIEREKRAFYIQMLGKYMLVLKLFGYLCISEFELTCRFNRDLRAMRQDHQAGRLDESDAAVYANAVNLASRISIGARSTGVPRFHCALHESLQRSTLDKLRHLQLSLLVPLSTQLQSIGDDLTPDETSVMPQAEWAEWMFTVEEIWLELLKRIVEYTNKRS